MNAPIEKRDPAMVLVISLFTCGFYLIYWYMKVYEEMEQLTGDTPTGNSFWLDFIIVVATCTLYGIYVDYKISLQLNDLQAQHGLPAHDTTMMSIVLDLGAFITGFLCNYITSAIHQDQLNKVVRAAGYEDSPVV